MVVGFNDAVEGAAQKSDDDDATLIEKLKK